MTNTRPWMFWMALPFLLSAVTIWEAARSTRNILKRSCVVSRAHSEGGK